MKYLAALLITILAAISGGYLWGLDPEGSGDVDFVYSNAPSDVLLMVALADPAGERVRAMTLYGDGRMELTHYGPTRQLLVLRELHLNDAEIRSLLQVAVDHGLPIYDSDAISRAQQSIEPARRPANEGRRPDPRLLVFHISLARYSAGGQVVHNLHKKLHYGDIGLGVRLFPQIRELRGLAAMEGKLEQFWSRTDAVLSHGSAETDAVIVPSTDPSEVVMDISVSVPQRGIKKFMKVYGDGRVVHATTGPVRIPSREMRIEVDEVEALLQTAADTGLVAYDAAKIDAWKLRASTSGLADPMVSDGGWVTIRIRLKEYERDGWKVVDADQTIRIYALGVMAYTYPEIAEYQGALVLLKKLYAFREQLYGRRFR